MNEKKTLINILTILILSYLCLHIVYNTYIYKYKCPINNDDNIDNQLNNQSNNPLNNQSNNPLNNQSNNPLNNQYNNPLNNQSNNPLNNQYNNPLNNQYNNQYNNQSNNQSNNPLNNQSNNQSNNPLNNQSNNPLNNQYNNQSNNPLNNQSNNPLNNQSNNQSNNPLNNQSNNLLNNQYNLLNNSDLDNDMKKNNSLQIRDIKKKSNELLNYENVDNNLYDINDNYMIINKCNNDVVINDNIKKRDLGVIHNDLYPPYGRTDRPTSDYILNNINRGLFNISTRDNVDTPRLLGYFYPLDNNNNEHHIYKLFGWAKYLGNSNGYFYFKSTDETKSFKYTLDDTNSNLKRIDDIPPIIKITDGPIRGEFKFDELKKSDLINRYM